MKWDNVDREERQAKCFKESGWLAGPHVGQSRQGCEDGEGGDGEVCGAVTQVLCVGGGQSQLLGHMASTH